MGYFQTTAKFYITKTHFLIFRIMNYSIFRKLNCIAIIIKLRIIKVKLIYVDSFIIACISLLLFLNKIHVYEIRLSISVENKTIKNTIFLKEQRCVQQRTFSDIILKLQNQCNGEKLFNYFKKKNALHIHIDFMLCRFCLDKENLYNLIKKMEKTNAEKKFD